MTQGKVPVSRVFRESAIVVHPYLKFRPGRSSPLINQESKYDRRHPDLALEEAVRLTAAINLDVVYQETVGLNEFRPATLLGSGVIDRLRAELESHTTDVPEAGMTVVIINHPLTPAQQRNLEKALKTKVLDRTGLILEIFGERAQSRAGQLQVELAAYEYQKSRLVRSWTHLERQRGGAGFMGGPGESQLEIDRRLIAERILKLKKDLVKVRKTRDVNRRSRSRSEYPTVALVGYTNAGKSTLFNRLTGASVLAKDMLFATLDPTMRVIQLADSSKVILSDTVGFITDLPTTLVEAFKSTLEEIIEADLILHVRDISHPETEEQRQDVIETLAQLGVDPDEEEGDSPPMVEVWNKMDILPLEKQEHLKNRARLQENVVCLSAQSGEGISDLLEEVQSHLSRENLSLSAYIPYADGATMAWIHQHAEILDKKMGKSSQRIDFKMKEEMLPLLQKLSKERKFKIKTVNLKSEV